MWIIPIKYLPLFKALWVSTAQAALMLDSGRFNLQANTDKIQHVL